MSEGGRAPLTAAARHAARAQVYARSRVGLRKRARRRASDPLSSKAVARSSPSADTSFPRCGFGGASRELLALARKHERAGGRVSVPTRLKHARVTRRRRQAEVRFGPAGSSALARRRSCDCAELLCGCALPCAGVAPVAAGGEPTMARERAGERVFGAVADGGRDRGDDVVGVLLLDAAWEPVVGDHAGAVA